MFRVDFRAYEYAKGYIEMTEDLVLPYRTEEPFMKNFKRRKYETDSRRSGKGKYLV